MPPHSEQIVSRICGALFRGSLMAFLSEAAVEQALLEQLRRLGYAVVSDNTTGPDGSAPERESHDVVILRRRLEEAALLLNPQLPPEAREDAIRKLTQNEF
nr:type I restriction endonuclease [Xanthomonas oryzae]